MNDKGNRYALAALKDRRATISAEIAHLEGKLRHRRQLLIHVDSCLKLLDPSIETDAIPNKRLTKRVKLFRQGELGRLILGALREADGKPIGTSAIVTAILKAGGHGEASRKTVAPRVRGNLSYLERRRKVLKTGSGKIVRCVRRQHLPDRLI